MVINFQIHFGLLVKSCDLDISRVGRRCVEKIADRAIIEEFITNSANDILMYYLKYHRKLDHTRVCGHLGHSATSATPQPPISAEKPPGAFPRSCLASE